jgi:hypothetical protein
MKNIILIVLLILLGSITSCKKWQKQYPEDTERTKDTPTERLSNKWWTLQNASINGKDYTDSVYQHFGKFKIYFGSTLYQTSLQGNDRYYGLINTELETSFTTIWTIVDNETVIGITPFQGTNSNAISIVPCFLSHSSFTIWSYSILKLSNNEFKISIKSNTNDSTVINNFITN